MLRRRDICEHILPRVPDHTAAAFAYRPYAAHRQRLPLPNKRKHSRQQQQQQQQEELVSPSTVNTEQSCTSSICGGAETIDTDEDDDAISLSQTPSARIIHRQNDEDGKLMAELHAGAIRHRISQAKKLVDDSRYEYACDVVYECQRGFNFLGKANFSTKLLHPMDPPPWCDTTMKLTLPNVHSFQLPDPSWQWVSPRWLIDMTVDVDEDGWQYSSKFSTKIASWHGRHSSAKSFVRRRRWLRLRRRLCSHQTTSADIISFSEEECPLPADDGKRDLGIVGAKQQHRHVTSVASKIKSKVSGNYVGKSPKSPARSASVKSSVAFTLKNGKYRSHSMKGMDSYVQQHIIPAAISASSWKHKSSAALKSTTITTSRLDDGFVPGTTIPYNAISHAYSHKWDREMKRHETAVRRDSANDNINQLSSAVASHRQLLHKDGGRRKSAHGSLATTRRSRETKLPLPTGGITQVPTMSIIGGSSDDMIANSLLANKTKGHLKYIGYVDGVPDRFPKLTGLGPPMASVPRVWSQPDGTEVAANWLRSRDSGASNVAAATTGTTGKTDAPPMPPLPRQFQQPANDLIEDDTGCSTVVASQPDLLINQQQYQQLKRPSISSMSSTDYMPSDLPKLDPYVDPYMAIDLPDPSGGNGPLARVSSSMGQVDDNLVRMTASALKQALKGILLDRERLEYIRDALDTGGVTAATVWYMLPWIHFELLQYDAGRQRLAVMLLVYSKSCPLDVPERMAGFNPRNLKLPLVDLLSERDRQEYQQLNGYLSPSQVWRFVVAPLVGQDPDLFYADFKIMVLGVARWCLGQI